MENYSNDNIARINALIDESTQKAARVISKYGKPKYIAALIEIVISCIAIIGIQIVTMGFDISRLATPEFWVRTLSLTACVFLLYRAVINARFETTASRQNVVDVMAKYKELSDDKDLDLKVFLEELNEKNKIKIYCQKFFRKINTLERKKISTPKDKKKNKYQKKIDSLKALVNPDYLKKVIQYLNVKYEVIWYDDFENIEKIGGNNNGIVSIRGYQSWVKAFNKSSFSNLGYYVLSSALMAISMFTIGDATVVQIISNILASVLMIVTRIVTAFVKADRLYDSTITAAYVAKNEILEEYYKWRNDKVEAEIKAKQEEQIKELNSEKPILIGTGKIEVA